MLIGADSVLPQLFDRVVIPQHVISVELQHTSTPRGVGSWAASPPAWVEVRRGTRGEAIGLGGGEIEAIALAVELHADAVLLDDLAARRIAAERGLAVMGTIGILERAAVRGLLDLPGALGRLLRTNFRIAPDVVRELLAREAARRRPPG